MFGPPPVIETEVFARLPDRFRRTGTTAPWLEAHLRGAERHSLLEGPAFDRQGNLYVTDIPYGRIFRVSPAGEFDLVAEYDGEPNGLAIHRDGRIFVADNKHGLMCLEPASGRVVPILDRPRHERFKGLNDLVFADDGTLYFTDQGQTGLHDPTGRVFRLSPDGTLDCLLDRVPSPNGVVPAADGSGLYVAVTRANAVWRVPFMRDGTPHKVGVYVQLSGGTGPDGLALAEDGSLAIAHVGLGCVWIVSPVGEPRYRVVSCEGLSVTNIAFGGDGFRDLFVTEAESGTILRARLSLAGRVPFSHR